MESLGFSSFKAALMKLRFAAFLLLVLKGSAAAQGRAPVASGAWTAREARVIVSAERLFGLHVYTVSYEPPEGDATEISGVMATLLQGQSVINSEDDGVNPYAVPRIAVDGVLARAFTVGGSFGFFATAGEKDTGFSRPNLPVVTGFALHARFGYLIVPSAAWAVWLRAGPEYSRGSYDDSGAQVENVTKTLALTVDPQLVVTPAPHAAILIGPLINVGVWGSYERRFPSSSEKTDFNISNGGVTGGIALFL
jgi:hypothetical protein